MYPLLIKLFAGAQILMVFNPVTELIRETFRQYPYLYALGPDFTEGYAHYCTIQPEALVLTAFDNNDLVGTIVGLPAQDYDYMNFKAACCAYNIEPSTCYYLGWGAVKPNYRRQGIMKHLYHTFEEQLKYWGYTHCCLATEICSDSNPLKPDSYESSEGVWHRLGFIKTAYQISSSWLTYTLQGLQEQIHTLSFWYKKL